MVRKPKYPQVEVVNPQKKTSNRHFGPMGNITIGNFPAPPYLVTAVDLDIRNLTCADRIEACPDSELTDFGDAYINTVRIPVDCSARVVNFPVFPRMFNGATWDRIRGTVAGGLLTTVNNLLNPHPVTIPIPTPVSDNAGSLTVDQATRTNLKVQPEREDLLIINADLATNVNPQAVLAAVANQYHKVYGWDYACDAAGTFEFQCTIGGATRKFARRKTAGVHAMTLVHPIVCDVNTALNFLSNGGNTYYSLRYKTEA